MAGFRKAKAEQAALKMGVYGPPGSGKTFTSLLIAEGLAKLSGKRVAYIDTEHGTDFYCQAVPTRNVHPEAFDFDAIYTRSMMDSLQVIRQISNDYCVIVIDSVTHLWQAAIEAYSGKQTRAGTIPMYAWGPIKKPYKDMMTLLLSSPMHVIICGRQGTEYATDEETDELKAVGVKMKAEGETPYEPHILIRMESIKPRKTNELAQIVAYAEKDRTGVLAGRSFINPTFETLCRPLLGLLGASQAQIENIDAAAGRDAERIGDEERNRALQSEQLREQYKARIALCEDGEALKAVGRMLTPQVKSQMLPVDVTALREVYQARERQISGSKGLNESPESQTPAEQLSTAKPTATTEPTTSPAPAPEAQGTSAERSEPGPTTAAGSSPSPADGSGQAPASDSSDDTEAIPFKDWNGFVEAMEELADNRKVPRAKIAEAINTSVLALSKKGKEEKIKLPTLIGWYQQAVEGEGRWACCGRRISN